MADSYYLDHAGRALLQEKGVNFMCSVSGDRFHSLRDMVSDQVTKPGEWAGLWNDESNEAFFFVWDKNQNVGKKCVLTNAFRCKAKRTAKAIVPVWDHYKVSFNLCDQFNRDLHDCTWPHRHVGGSRLGDLASVHDFIFSSILQNVQNAWLDKQGFSSENFTFQDICTRLADELYIKASSM